MTMNRLVSSTQHYTRESVARTRPLTAEPHRRVEASDGVEGDRPRSLHQELAEAPPEASAPAGGSVVQRARQLAAQLVALGGKAVALLRPVQPPARRGIDDRA